jgi:hypothetical protein
MWETIDGAAAKWRALNQKPVDDECVWVVRVLGEEAPCVSEQDALDEKTMMGDQSSEIRGEPASNFDLTGAKIITGVYRLEGEGQHPKRIAGEPLPEPVHDDDDQPEWVWVMRIYGNEGEQVYSSADSAASDMEHYGHPDFPVRREPASNF